MKKNKLTFLLATSFLALAALVGCNKAEEPSEESKTPISSETPISSVISGNDNNSSSISNSNIGSSDIGGNSSSSAGGNSSSDGGSTSQGGGSTSQSGGQETKTDWTDAEKAKMRNALHGIVLPYVEMDVEIRDDLYENEIIMTSADNMQEGFLAKYAAKFTYDDGWEGGDYSSEYGFYDNSGMVYGFVKEVTQNSKRYYVSVMFTGIVDPTSTRTTYSKTGKFVLQTGEPYVADYPTEFISSWLQQMYQTTINPPAFQAKYYCLADTGVLYGYSETNIEGSYKTALVGTNNFTVDADRDAQGYYVAHPKDGSYVLRFQYNAADKMFVIMVSAPKGWNATKIDAIFAKYNVTPFAIPAINNDNIGFSITDMESGGVTYVSISVTKVTTQMVQTFVNDLKTAGYKVAVSTVDDTESQWITTANVFTDDGMYTLYVMYYPKTQTNTEAQLSITFSLQANASVKKAWPTAEVAAAAQASQDTVPAFAGNAYGYSMGETSGMKYVVVHVDEGTEVDAKTSYIGTLTGAGYIANGSLQGQPRYKSAHSEINVTVMAFDSNPGEIAIFIQPITDVATQWPSADIANAIKTNIVDGATVTDTIPELNVAEASKCTISTNYTYEFRIDIKGLASSIDTFKKVFENNGWFNDVFYEYDTNLTGGMVSPSRQLVACFDVVGNDLSIYVKRFYQHPLTIAGLNGDWNYNHSEIRFSDANDQTQIDQGWYVSQQLAVISVKAGDSFKVTNGVDWYGYDDIQENAVPSKEDFDTDENGNIVAMKDGDVNVYLKTLSDGSKKLYIAYKPVLLPWPTDGLALFFGDVFTTIPEIENDSASFAVTGQTDTADYKSIYITVTVANPSEAKADAISQLETNYNYSLDTTRNVYVSSDDGLPIVGFGLVDDDSFEMYLTYMVPVTPEPDGYPTEDIASWLSSFHATDALPNIHLENVTYTTDTDMDGNNVLVYTPTGLNTVSGIIDQLSDIFEDAANGFTEYNIGYYFSEHGDYSIDISIDGEDVRVTFIPSGLSSIYPSAKLSQYLNGLTVAATLANFSLEDGSYEWYWPTESDPYATLEIYKTGYSSADYDDLLEGLIFDLKQEGFVERYFDDLGIDVLVSPNREYCLELFATADCACINIYNFANLESPATLVGNYALTPQDGDGWIFNGDAIFYAYVWGGIYGEYQWIEIFYDDTDECFYLNDIDDSATGLIIVRMDPAGKDEEGWEPGWSHVWNQTSDINIRAINVEYTFHIIP